MKHNFLGAMAAVSFLLSGCGDVGSVSSSEDARTQQAKDSKALEDLYSGVQGVWEGSVSNASIGLSPFKGELSIYVYYIQDGTNSDGTPRLRPTLRGRFRPAEFVTETDDIILVGDYDRSGRLIMTAQSAAASASGAGSSGVPAILSLRGSISQGKLNLEISRQGGVWGFYEAVRVKSFASAPVAGASSEDRERFEKIYGPIEGRYSGRMKSLNGNDYMVEIALVLVEGESESGVATGPVLTGFYQRLDGGSGTGLEAAMDVTYNAQTGDIYMRNVAGSGVGTLSLSGVLVTVQGKKTLRVKARNKSSVLGSIEAVRN